jgi:hypothetical protein
MMRPVEPQEIRVSEATGNGGKSGGGPASRAPESRKGDAAEPTAAERRAQALRDNLHRRKAQARARKAGPDGESQSSS